MPTLFILGLCQWVVSGVWKVLLVLQGDTAVTDLAQQIGDWQASGVLAETGSWLRVRGFKDGVAKAAVH